MSASLHPILPLLIAALGVPVAGRLGGRILSVAGPLCALWLVITLSPDAQSVVRTLDYDFVLLQGGQLGRFFALAFTGYAFIASLFAWRTGSTGARVASLGMAAGGVGVALAGDLLTLFVCWEWLTVCSLSLIWAAHTKAANAAGMRYVLFHVAGGMCLLSGILIHLHSGGSARIEALATTSPGWWLILLGLATNAAIPPLHAWLPDAYPQARPEGTVFLSAYTTKAAVYALLCLFPGTHLLVYTGVAMALYGVFFAMLENDLRRLLSYHIISQVGFMVCGVGLGTQLALNGSATHAFCAIFNKGLLMMSAAAVITATGKDKLSDLGQLARPLRWTLLFCLVGALSISGVPLFNGFVSKSLIITAAAETHNGTVELLLLSASMGTFLCIGLKLTWFVFSGPNPAAPVLRPVPWHMLASMSMASGVCFVTGILPQRLYALLPGPVEYLPFTPDHIVGVLQLLLATALGFWILRSFFGGKASITLDVDRLYRRPLTLLLEGSTRVLESIGQGLNTPLNALPALSCRASARLENFMRRENLGWHISVLMLCLAVLAAVMFV